MKLWGARFSGATDEAANHFHSSISFDKRLYRQDITGSIAHANMLGKQGIIPQSDADAITKALHAILLDIEDGSLEIDPNAEDIHSFVEAELVARIGEAGRRLHTGRSRNDQVALDMRMYVKDQIDATCELLVTLMETLLATADDHTESIMPGFTHLQKAQPVTLAHHLLAYVHMFKRDFERLRDCYSRTDSMPLGASALAATSYPLNRDLVCKTLGFAGITANSLDAVSDRDFCVEFVSALSIIMMHLSRFCEELILWSTDAFGFIELSDAYSTGSSIMPQKKNPDMAELIRGKTGRVYGNLVGLLTVLKGLPLAYNKDMQEDKEAVFDAAETVASCLTVFTGMLGSITFNTETMYHAAHGAYTNATDVADWLVKRGVTFRAAHDITGKLVVYAIKEKKRLEDLTLAEFKRIAPIFDQTLYKSISIAECVNSRSIAGGPAKATVSAEIQRLKAFLSECRA